MMLTSAPFRWLASFMAAGLLTVACGAEDSSEVGTDDDQEVSALQTCAGKTGRACSGSNVCVDDPRDSCDATEGDKDCGGVCVSPRSKKCGGFAGLTCPVGSECVDDPRDSCDPGNGGRDCMGLCVKVQSSSGPHCPTIRCASGFHCEEKGINGGTVGVCLRNSSTGPHCTTIRCQQGFHCEEKGINGGSIGVCIHDADPQPVCTKMILCARGFKFDRNDCACVQICGGFAGLGCPSGKRCVDDPSDSCNPSSGGRDCAGLCR